MAQVTSDATVFGTAAIASLGLDLDERGSASIDVALTFEQALRLHFALGQALAAMNAEETQDVTDAIVAAHLRVDTRRRHLAIAVGDAVAQHPGDTLPGLGLDPGAALDGLQETGPVEVMPPPKREPAPAPRPAAPAHIDPASIIPEETDKPDTAPPSPPASKKQPAPPAEQKSSDKLDKNLEHAVKAFLEAYPNGFMDPDFIERHRSNPSIANQRYLESLGGDRGELLLNAGDLETLVESAIEVLHESRLLSRGDLASLEHVLHDDDSAHKYFQAVFALASDFEPNERNFRSYANSMESLAREHHASGVATWPVATILPHLARPEVFAFFDPSPIRRCAERLDFNINYSPELNWKTYARVLRMCDNVMQRIGSLGARDLIDLCAFLRVTENK